MAGLKEPLQDILTRLSTLNVKNGDGFNVKLYTRMWNNQFASIQDGSSYSFSLPAVFVEVLNPLNYVDMGAGARSSDLRIRLHLLQEQINLEGSFEQDLRLFDLRNQILGTNLGLSSYVPTACTALRCIEESVDVDHNNVNHHLLDFICNFTDSRGSEYDSSQGNYFDDANPDMDAIIEAEYLIHRS